jgi:DNA-binding IclR family transcriptional regulator
VLFAVCSGASTFGGISKATGMPKGTVYAHVAQLSIMGLVAWEYGKSGTIRPLVRITQSEKMI